MAEPTKVTVTGAAGAIGYAILFRIACGQMLGPRHARFTSPCSRSRTR